MTPTLSRISVTPALDELARRGIEAAPVLRASGIDANVLADPDCRLPLGNAMAVWEAAADHAGDRGFGARAAARLPAGKYGVLDYLFSTSDTLDTGFGRVCAFVRIAYDQSDLALSHAGNTLILGRTTPTGSAHYDEFIACLLVLRARAATGTPLRPRETRFRHAERSGSTLAKVLQGPIVYDAPSFRLELAASAGELPLRTKDAELNAVLARYGAAMLANLPKPHASPIEDLRDELVRALPAQLPTLAGIAQVFAVTPRTLQRRLEAAGTTFQRELDVVRKGCALKYMTDPTLSIAEIAFLLHYSEAPAFQRAFKRWTGTSPRAYRTRLWADVRP